MQPLPPFAVRLGSGRKAAVLTFEGSDSVEQAYTLLCSLGPSPGSSASTSFPGIPRYYASDVRKFAIETLVEGQLEATTVDADVALMVVSRFMLV